MVTTQASAIQEILDLDHAAHYILRNSNPESWLGINLPVGSTRALLAIEGMKGATPGRVAEVLGIGRTSVTGLLDRLEEQGLLTRRVDPSDRRCFLLELTDKGHELVQQLNEPRREKMRQALEQMSQDEIAALRNGMEALVLALKE